jgi:hypothetical protein
MADADRARRADFLNSEYSSKSTFYLWNSIQFAFHRKISALNFSVSILVSSEVNFRVFWGHSAHDRQRVAMLGCTACQDRHRNSKPMSRSRLRSTTKQGGIGSSLVKTGIGEYRCLWNSWKVCTRWVFGLAAQQDFTKETPSTPNASLFGPKASLVLLCQEGLLYRNFGLAALGRRGRSDRGGHRGLSSKILEIIEALALQKPSLPVCGNSKTNLPNRIGPGTEGSQLSSRARRC